MHLWHHTVSISSSQVLETATDLLKKIAYIFLRVLSLNTRNIYFDVCLIIFVVSTVKDLL